MQIPDISQRLPLLITGLAGVAGFNAFHYFREKYPGQVFGIRRKDLWSMTGDGILAIDVEDRKALQQVFDTHQFGSILNTGGSCALKHCELDFNMAQRVNVEGIANLLELIAGTSTRLVHLSIDLVFSGTCGGGHRETDPVDPVSAYGKTMVMAEQLVATRRPETPILRISLPMGISYNGHAGAIDWIQNRFKFNRPATLYYDEVRTPTYTDCLNRLFEVMLGNDLGGLYHTGGKVRLSLFEIAQIVNRVGGYDPRWLEGCYRLEAGPLPPRAGNVTMISDKIRKEVGFDPFAPWPYHDDFIPTHREWHKERSPSLQGSPGLLAETLYRNPAIVN
ncbi:MAG: sugar nucleotide-binding protein [Planctomycetota bacterium]|nr:sugar nucleotide-binding protein [Planctomycetota bacterium]